MRMLLTSILAASVIAVAAASILWSVQNPAYVTGSSTSVRVGEPGYNLVGEKWTGNPNLSQAHGGDTH